MGREIETNSNIKYFHGVCGCVSNTWMNCCMTELKASLEKVLLKEQ